DGYRTCAKRIGKSHSHLFPWNRIAHELTQRAMRQRYRWEIVWLGQLRRTAPRHDPMTIAASPVMNQQTCRNHEHAELFQFYKAAHQKVIGVHKRTILKVASALRDDKTADRYPEYCWLQSSSDSSVARQNQSAWTRSQRRAR